MTPGVLLTLAACLMLCAGAGARAQAPASHTSTASSSGADSSALAAFVAAAREGTARYRDQGEAVREGFRRLGPDFPGMGEHWINVGRVFDESFDAARPSMLSYATIDSKPTLIGVVYARPLLAGEQPPDTPAGRRAWHDHALTVEEEALTLAHVPHAHGAETPARIALLHAWVWLENPDGMFASDNWALPFARLGLPIVGQVTPASAKAASLIAGGDAHALWVLERLARPDSAERLAIEAVMDRYRKRVRAILAPAAGEAVSPSELLVLEQAWRTMWTELASTVGEGTRERIGRIPGR
jgi:hypothetical protein